MTDQSTPSVRLKTAADESRGQELLAKANANVERYRQGDAHIRFSGPSGKPLQGLEVEIVQVSQDFLFGNLLFNLLKGDQAYKPDLFKQRFLELFNLGILPFAWANYERQPGITEAHSIMPILEWCQSNRVTPKGYPLVWPFLGGIPEWLYDMPEGSVNALTQERVVNIVKSFASNIHIWDVANEAVNHISWKEATSREFHTQYLSASQVDGHPAGVNFRREIPISEAANWVEESFRWAYSTNPQAILILNDYNQEISLNVRQRFFDLVRELQRRKTPVSGLGLQVHTLNRWVWPDQIWNTLEMYSRLNVPIHITEMNQPSWEQAIVGGWRQGLWTETAQAEYVEQLYRLFFGHPSVVSISYWGLSDRGNWVDRGGLVDAEYSPKPVFNVLKKLIKGEWLTGPLTTRTGMDGGVSWRGFFGQYEVTVRQPEKKDLIYQFHLSEKDANKWVITL